MSPADKRSNQRTALWLGALAIGMFGFGYALVPLYDMLCTLTGLNGTTQRLTAEQATRSAVDTSRFVTVQFISNTNGLPWDFYPRQKAVRVHPGEATPVEFVARNRAHAMMWGTAVHSVSPSEGARFFIKTDCFCFNQQQLQAGQERVMPVRFIVSSHLPKTVSTMTLSYTFFRVPSESVKLGVAAARALLPAPPGLPRLLENRGLRSGA
jgi:cytochrome c oxidase assembly protein subunit 11